MKRRTRILFLLVPLLVLGFVVLPILFLSGGGSNRRAVEAYKRDLLAKGEKLDLAAFAPPPFTNPVDGDLFASLSNAPTRVLNPPQMMRLTAPGVAEIGHQNLPPLASASYEANTNRAAALRALFRHRSAADFRLNYSNYSLLALYRLDTAHQVLCETAVEALGAHNDAECEADLRSAIDVARLFTDEPSVGLGSFRASMVLTAVSATWEVLQTDRTNVPWTELQTNWEGVDLLGSFASNLKLDRAFMLDQFVHERKGVPPQVAVSAVLRVPTLPGTNASLGPFTGLRQKLAALFDIGPRYWRWRASWAYDEELYGLQILDCGLAVDQRIHTPGAFAPALAEFDTQVSRLAQAHAVGAPHFRLVTVPGEILAVSNALVRFADAETARRLTVTAIALKRYHLAHHAYPASLRDLVPQYLAEVPRDFMDGKPLRYTLQPDGNFLLYSVGEDGEDNAGDGTSLSPTYWLKRRDIVWPRAATAKEIEEYQEAQAKKSANVPTQ